MRKTLWTAAALAMQPHTGNAQEIWTERQAMKNDGSAGVIEVSGGRPGLYLAGTTKYMDPVPERFGWLRQYWRSVDGIKWEETQLPHALEFVVWKDRVFAAGYDGIWSTEDGVSWAFATFEDGQNRDFNNISIGNGMMVATGGGYNIYYCTDGEHWTNAQYPGNRSYGTAFGDGKFLVASEGWILASENGKDWSMVSKVDAREAEPLSFAQGRFTISGSGSTDGGKTWIADTGIPRVFAEGPGGMVFPGTDGWRFSRRPGESTPITVGQGVNTLAYAGNLWIAGGVGGWIATSPDTTAPPLTPPVVQIAPAVELSWPSVKTRGYRVQTSEDNVNWTDTGLPLVGDGGMMRFTSPAAEPRRFWRVQVK